MSNLRPEQRADHTGKVVTRWIREHFGRGNTSSRPIPAVRITNPASGNGEHSDFVAANVGSHWTDLKEYSGRLSNLLSLMSQSDKQRLSDFAHDPEVHPAAHILIAEILSHKAFSEAASGDNPNVSFTRINNAVLLADDFVRSCPQHVLPDSPASSNYHQDIGKLEARIVALSEALRPQNAKSAPDFSKQSEAKKRRARIGMVIANNFYATAPHKNQRHKEKDLIDYVDRNFDRRFEIASVLDRRMDATPELIDEMLQTNVSEIQDGFL